MRKALVICAGGMSSSLIAKKTAEYLNNEGYAIEMDAVGVPSGKREIQKDTYDLYLVSPQTRLNYPELAKEGIKVGKPVVQIPPQAYVPIPMGIEKMANLVKENL